jgi:hypothetical protein
LWNTFGGKPRLVVENPAKMIAIRKYLILQWQKGATGIDQVHTWQAVLFCNLLCAQMFLYSKRIVSAALHCRVIRNDHAIDVIYLANARNDPCRRNFIVVQAIGSQLTYLKEWRTTIHD